MPPDKFSATWVSHSSISDYLACPRAYFLKNVYKDPKTNHKIQIVAPALSLGQAVHEILEGLSTLPTNTRFSESLIERYEKLWPKFSGRAGGFSSPEQEKKYRDRGAAMLRRVMQNPGPLAQLAVKIKGDLPYFWLSEEDNIILCGKIDWLQYFPDEGEVRIIDFKTSKTQESASSLQLPIYRLLTHHCQKYPVREAAYWYLELSDELSPKELPDLEKAEKQVLEIARKIKLARKLEKYACPEGKSGCRHCRPFERILAGEGEFLSEDNFRRDLYYLPWSPTELKEADKEEIL